jgi:hypothetical protein
MFNSIVTSEINNIEVKNDTVDNINQVNSSTNNTVGKYKNIITSSNDKLANNEMSMMNIDAMLEKEKQYNKLDSWNKLDKTLKVQKLCAFSERYGKENHLSMKEVSLLKQFFNECLIKNKLQKKKDIIYDKTQSEIISIPSLFFNNVGRNFTLKNTDTKRVSTLKSLTPKRISIKETDIGTSLDVQV